MDPTAALITIHLLQFFFFSILLLQSIHFSSRFFSSFLRGKTLCVGRFCLFVFMYYQVGPARPASRYIQLQRPASVLIRSLNFILQLIAYSYFKKKTLPPLTKKNKSRNCWGPADKKPAPRQQQMAFSLSVFPLFLLGALSLFCECRIYTSERKCPFHVVFDINGVRAPTEVSYFRVDLGKPPTGLVSLSLILWPRKPRVNFSGIGGSQQVSGEYMAERDTTTTSGYTCLCNFFFVFLLFLVIREC